MKSDAYYIAKFIALESVAVSLFIAGFFCFWGNWCGL